MNDWTLEDVTGKLAWREVFWKGWSTSEVRGCRSNNNEP